MGLIFNKYFRHAGSEPNRRISLILDSSCDPTPTVIGAVWDGADNATLFRHDCDSASVGLTTYRHTVQTWIADGFSEVAPLNYWHGALPPEPELKPDWQRALDELAVDFDVDEQLVHHRRGRLVLEALVGHDVAPMAGGVSDRQQDRPIAALGLGERFGPPRPPVHRIVLVLQQIR